MLSIVKFEFMANMMCCYRHIYICMCVVSVCMCLFLMCVPCKINFKLVQLWHLAADTCDPSPKKVPFSLPKHKCDLLANGKSSLTATTTTIILVQLALLTNAIKFIYANLILKATLSEQFYAILLYANEIELQK